MDNTTSIARGAAVAEYVGAEILLCGGRDKNNLVSKSCLGYHIMRNEWEEHSELIDLREEAASVVLSGQVFRD